MSRYVLFLLIEDSDFHAGWEVGLMDDSAEKSTPAGYLIAIVAVVGGTLMMSPFDVFSTVIGALLLLGLMLFMLVMYGASSLQETTAR